MYSVWVNFWPLCVFNLEHYTISHFNRELKPEIHNMHNAFPISDIIIINEESVALVQLQTHIQHNTKLLVFAF